MRFEELLEEVNGFGKYQILVFIMLCLPRLIIPMHLLLHNFISAFPSHHCALPGISNFSWNEVVHANLPREPDGMLSSCKMFSQLQFDLQDNSSSELSNASSIQNCKEGWVYDHSQFASTTATEWDLVCEKKSLNQAIATFFYIGVTIGSVLFGYLSDRFGRRIMLLLSFFVALFFGNIAAFSVSYVMFIIMMTICGMGIAGMSIISLILAVEWTDIKHRTFCGTINSISWSLGYMLLALVAYLIRTWRWLLFIVTSPCLIGMIICWWLPESARWLLTKKKVEAAHGYLSTCAKVNGKTEFNSRISPEVLQKAAAVEESRSYSYWHLVKSPKLRKITIYSSIVWFGVAFTYYGISLNISGFSLDPYLTHFTFGAIEIPAKLGVYYVLDHIGRRHCQAWSLIAAGSFIALNTVIPAAYGHVRSAVAILGKGFAEASFTTVFLYTAELYPTVLRQSGVGWCSFVARFASSIAPLIMLLDDIWKHLPATTFSIVAVTTGMVALLLSETTNVDLPESIEDIEKNRNKSFSGAQDHGTNTDGDIALGMMNQTNTDAAVSQQEANNESDGKQQHHTTLLANSTDTSGC